jgi:hypothetical protein
MGTLAIFAGIMVLLTVAAMWLTKLAAKAQTAKSIGELLNEQSEANDALKTRNDVLVDTPVSGANRRLQDKWQRPG